MSLLSSSYYLAQDIESYENLWFFWVECSSGLTMQCNLSLDFNNEILSIQPFECIPQQLWLDEDWSTGDEITLDLRTWVEHTWEGKDHLRRVALEENLILNFQLIEEWALGRGHCTRGEISDFLTSLDFLF